MRLSPHNRWGIFGLSLLVIISLASWFLLVFLSHRAEAGIVWWLLGIMAVQWLSALIIWRRTPAAFICALTVCGLSFRLLGLFAVPILEDDHFRFLWDGRMSALTGNPYASPPSAHFADATVPEAFAEILDHINYPDLQTIYGPVCQLGFLASYLIAPAALWPWKLILFVADIALVVLLSRSAPGQNDVRAGLFAAWCPLSIFESAFNAHPDGLGVSLLVLAMTARFTQRDVFLGLALGIAVCAKVFAILVAPFLLWRRRLRSWAVFVATAVACYLPIWLQGSAADLESLRTMGAQWEFNSSIYALLASAMHSQAARILALGLFALVWLMLFWRHTHQSSSKAPSSGALLVVYLSFFLLSPTFNPWYALWLLPFVALQPSFTGITTLIVVTLTYVTQANLGMATLDGFAHPAWVRPLEFGAIALAVFLDLWHLRHNRKGGKEADAFYKNR